VHPLVRRSTHDTLVRGALRNDRRVRGYTARGHDQRRQRGVFLDGLVLDLNRAVGAEVRLEQLGTLALDHVAGRGHEHLRRDREFDVDGRHHRAGKTEPGVQPEFAEYLVDAPLDEAFDLVLERGARRIAGREREVLPDRVTPARGIVAKGRADGRDPSVGDRVELPAHEVEAVARLALPGPERQHDQREAEESSGQGRDDPSEASAHATSTALLWASTSREVHL
jgi:hypothetical protein